MVRELGSLGRKAKGRGKVLARKCVQGRERVWWWRRQWGSWWVGGVGGRSGGEGLEREEVVIWEEERG